MSGDGAGAPPGEGTTLDGRSVLELLFREPRSFEFFQAVRLLEKLSPESEPIGGFGRPENEAVRIGVNPSLAFPVSEIESLEAPEEEGGRIRMSVNFLGLTGPSGVLPHRYTLMVADEERAGEGALGDFLDIFHHRLLSLFYRAWKKHQFTVAFEEEGEDPLTSHLLDLVGRGIPASRDRALVDDRTLARYAGLMRSHGRSAAALETMIQDFFGVPAEIVQFVGAWYPISRTDQCALGLDDAESARDPSSSLGIGSVVGDEVWDEQARVRIRLGPMSRERFDEFLPGRRGHDELGALTRQFSDGSLDFEVQLVLNGDEVPGCVLGRDDEDEQALGWSTWIRSAPFGRDADETTLML